MTNKEPDLGHFQKPCLDGATIFKLAMLSCSFCQRYGGKMLKAGDYSLLVCKTCATDALEKAKQVNFKGLSDSYCFWHGGESADWQVSVSWPFIDGEKIPSCCFFCFSLASNI